MSAPHIKLSYQGMTSAINRLLQAKDEFEHALEIVETTISSLDDVWTGQAQIAMKEKFEQQKSVFDNFSEEIESYADDMIEYRDELSNTDKELAADIDASCV